MAEVCFEIKINCDVDIYYKIRFIIQLKKKKNKKFHAKYVWQPQYLFSFSYKKSF